MSATFWFLLEYSVFFALVALVFGLVGWWLRGPGPDSRAADLESQLAEQQRIARAAMDERDAIRTSVRDSSTHVSEAAHLVEENQSLASANSQLESELATARRELNTRSEALAAALATASNLESENAQLLSQSAAALSDSSHRSQRVETELETLKTAHDHQIAELQRQLTGAPQVDPAVIERLESENARLLAEAAQNAQRAETELNALKTAYDHQVAESQRQLAEAPQVDPAPVEKAKPKPTPKPKAPRAKKKSSAARVASGPDRLAQIEHELAPQLAVLAALTQERDDWEKRVHTLENQSLPDPAGLGLSRRSLVGSQERLTAAQDAAKSLQNQQRALQKALAQSAELPEDDLTQIKGIKTVLSDHLHAHGIRTWRQIAEWTDDDLAAFSELLAFKNRATRDNWREQARQLHEATHGPLV